MGIVGKFTIDNLPQEIASLVSHGLLHYDNQGELKYLLAKDLKIDEDGKIWTVTINENARWHDGTKISLDDLRYDIPDTKVVYKGKNTLIFELNDKYSPFYQFLEKPVLKNKTIGLGEWKIISKKRSGKFISEIKLKNQQGDTKTFRVFPTENSLKTAYKIGKVQTLSKITNPEPFDEWDNSIVEKTPDDRKIAVVFFNTEDKNYSNKSIRQALDYAIKKDNFAENRAVSPISKSSWAYNPLVKKYDFDLEKAQELLEKSLQPGQNLGEITLISNPLLLDTAEAIAKDWEQLKIKTNILISQVIPDDFQAYLTIIEIPKDPDQYTLWHSTQTETNILNYSNPRVDRLLEEGRKEMDMDKRKQIYIDFQRFLIEDSPAIFLYYPNFYNVTRK